VRLHTTQRWRGREIERREMI
jgi:hypothetical protein